MCQIELMANAGFGPQVWTLTDTQSIASGTEGSYIHGWRTECPLRSFTEISRPDYVYVILAIFQDA